MSVVVSSSSSYSTPPITPWFVEIGVSVSFGVVVSYLTFLLMGASLAAGSVFRFFEFLAMASRGDLNVGLRSLKVTINLE